MRTLIVLTAILALSATFVRGEDEQPASEQQLTREEAGKLRVKELRKLLAGRGQACSGCVEKHEFVEKFMEVQHLPLVKAEPPKSEEPSDPGLDKAKLDELLASLKGAGGGGMNFQAFTAKDFEGLSPDEMAKKFGGGSNGRGPPKSNKRQSSKKAKVEEDHENIEL
jgi:hypothetical protein